MSLWAHNWQYVASFLLPPTIFLVTIMNKGAHLWTLIYLKQRSSYILNYELVWISTPLFQWASFIEETKFRCTGAVWKRFPKSSELQNIWHLKLGEGEIKPRFSLFCIWEALSASLAEKLMERGANYSAYQYKNFLLVTSAAFSWTSFLACSSSWSFCSSSFIFF